MRKFFLVSSLALATTFPAAASATEVGAGAGMATCAVFAKAYAATPDMTEGIFFTWAQGFMSGMNVQAPGHPDRILNAKTQDEEKREIREYCDAHPLKTYAAAVISVFISLPTTILPP